MTTTELEAIADQIHDDFPKLRSDRIVGHVKLLRSIEISALREALELVGTIKTNPEQRGWQVLEELASTKQELTAKIRNLELK